MTAGHLPLAGTDRSLEKGHHNPRMRLENLIQIGFTPPRAWSLLLLRAVLAACWLQPHLAQANEQPDPADRDCLALAMYWEAKAEGKQGMLAVGHVVLNRMRHDRFPDQICSVVKQGGERPPCQFSWWCDGKSDRPRELENWRRAQRLAGELLRGEHRRDPTRGALFFHAKGLRNPWKVPRTRTVTIGGHVFYKL